MALKMYDNKEFSVDEIGKNCNIGKTTLYRLLSEKVGDAARKTKGANLSAPVSR